MGLEQRHTARAAAVTRGHRMGNWRLVPAPDARVSQMCSCTVCGRTLLWRDAPGPFEDDAEGLALTEDCHRRGDPLTPRSRARADVHAWTVQYNGQFRSHMYQYIGRQWETELPLEVQKLHAERWIAERFAARKAAREK